MFRAADTIPAVADEIIALDPARRPAVVWLQTGIANPEAEARLDAAGFRVVSDKCLGVYAARLRPRVAR